MKVTQVSNLLYRRFPIGRAGVTARTGEMSVDAQAGSPAIQQVGNLRYSKQTLLASLKCS